MLVFPDENKNSSEFERGELMDRNKIIKTNQTEFETETSFDYKKILEKEPEELLWMDLLKTKVRSPKDILRQKYDALKLGEAVHYVLSLVKFLPDDKLSNKIEIASKKFRIEKEKIEKNIKNIFETPEFKKFFTKTEEIKIYNELEVINRFGEKRKTNGGKTCRRNYSCFKR
jgi:hypothetical protein